MALIDIEALLTPISEDFPSGNDARYEFCYEMMEAEIKKFGSLFGETVDWPVVKKYSTEVLSSHSKDLKAICYLTRALVEEAELDGLGKGLDLLLGSIVRYGSDLYPNRKRGRDGAISWLNQHLKLSLEKYSDKVTSWGQLSACQELVSKVQYQFDDVFHDSDADFFELRSVLNGLLQRVDAKSVSSEVKNAEAYEASDTNNQTHLEVKPTTTREPQLKKDEESAVVSKPVISESKPQPKKRLILEAIDVDTDFTSPSASRKTLKSVADVLISADVSLPLCYRIFRHLTWFDIDSLPEQKDNVTPLSLAISQDQQIDYQEKAKCDSDIETLKRLERTLTDAPFWVTGHFLVYSMLKNLGFDSAAKAVKSEVQVFVNTLPSITSLQFKNSIPFADEATINWLSSGVENLSVNQSQSINYVMDGEAVLQMEDITLGNFGDYAADIANKLELANSGRGQFMLLVQMVQVHQTLGLFSLCLPYLEKLWVIQNEMSLKTWEPHLYLQVKTLMESTLTELYPSKEQLPTKFQEWETLYN